MTELELKAKAYDILAQIQFLQNELARINAELAARAQSERKEEDVAS